LCVYVIINKRSFESFVCVEKTGNCTDRRSPTYHALTNPSQHAQTIQSGTEQSRQEIVRLRTFCSIKNGLTSISIYISYPNQSHDKPALAERLLQNLFSTGSRLKAELGNKMAAEARWQK